MRGVQHCNAKEASWKQPLRILLLAANLFNVLLICYIYYPYRLIQFFTNLTLLATVVYLAIAVCAHYRNKWLTILALHHVWFEVMFMMNIIVVSVFWSSLYFEAILECEGDPIKILNVYYAHICPGVSALLCFMITDVTIRASHVKIIVPIGVAYGFINYFETKKRGKPLYWFLTWEDETSFIIYGGLIVVFSALWFGLSSFTLALKPRPAPKGSQKRSISPTKRNKIE